MKNAYIFGCSHAAGDEMFGYQTDLEYTHSYPALIANHLGYHTLNHSIPGGSNDAMFRAFCEQIDNITPKDIVMFCWIGPCRAEVYSEHDNQWLQFAVGRSAFHLTRKDDIALEGRFTEDLVKNPQGWENFHSAWIRHYLDSKDVNARVNRRRNVVAANSLASAMGLRVINLISFGDWIPTEWRFVDGFYWPLEHTEFVQWCDKNQFKKTKNGHFLLDAHLAFSEHAMKVLGNSKFKHK